jgi:hypothetical protein
LKQAVWLWNFFFSSGSELLGYGILFFSRNRHGALLIMMAEMTRVALSPSAHNVPMAARQLHFLRYYKQQEPAFWAIINVSVDNLGSTNPTAPLSSICLRRRPLGVLI